MTPLVEAIAVISYDIALLSKFESSLHDWSRAINLFDITCTIVLLKSFAKCIGYQVTGDTIVVMCYYAL